MNPQPEPYVGTLFAILFIVLVVVYTIYYYLRGDGMNISDAFTIGYIEDTEANVTNFNIVNKNEVSKTPKPPKIESTPFFKDCVEALYSIGIKKSEAKVIAKDVISRENPKTIQEFLFIAMKK